MDPFLVDQPTVISFSGGRTSAYMLWRVLQSNNGLPKEAIVCFANTGKEEEATLRFVDRCSKEWNVPITWLEYADAPEVKDRFKQVTFETASRDGEPFEALILKRKYLPNPVSRFCTVELKVRTIHRYLKANGWTEWDSMIGIRADEQRRLAKIGNQDYGKHEEKVAPLGRVGITKELVGEFWRSQPFDLELPNMNGVTKHGNCDLCYLKPAGQVLSLIQEKPSRAIWWAKMEQVIQSTGQLTGDGARFRSDRPSYSQMASFTDQQTDMFDTNEEGIACFCGD
jgi:3'-phosphoadenosine 5'-phosphosulfate sulfotransferase (PAPS reductase)/FAD synthetase